MYLKQKVKGKDQHLYDGRYSGGNGTYVVGGEYDSYIWLKVFIYSFNSCVFIDIKDLVLSVNSRSKVSEKMINTLVQKNVGKKVQLDENGEPYYSQLDLVV